MNEFLELPLSRVLGRAAGKLEKKLGLKTVHDLLYYFPRRYHLKGELTSFSQLVIGEEQSVLALITQAKVRRTSNGKWMLTLTLSDMSAQMEAVFWAKSENMARWMARQLHPGRTLLFSGKPGMYNGVPQLTHPTYEPLEDPVSAEGENTADQVAYSPSGLTDNRDSGLLNPADDADISELHAKAKLIADQPEPIYSASAGLPTWNIAKTVRTVLDMAAGANLVDPIPEPIRAKYGFPELIEALQLIHTPGGEEDYKLARERFAYEESLLVMCALAQQRARDALVGVPRLEAVAGGFYDRVRAALPFTLTPAQNDVLNSIDTYFCSGEALNALLQADVGSGKTVVALLAMLRAVDVGFQAVFLAPTEILAEQHFRTLNDFCQRGQGSAVVGGMADVHLLTSSAVSAHKREVLGKAAGGEPGIFVGTHALLDKNVQFGALGLAVVDEQHRFGVEQRSVLRQPSGPAGLRPHLLVMSATPIPRTIAMTSFGDLDLLTLDSGPRQAGKVQTVFVPESNSAWMRRVWQRAADDVKAGGRVFVVCSKIDEDSPSGRHSVAEVEARLRELPQLAGIDVGSVHGRMSAEEKAQALADFASGVKPVLVATVVIEVGIDVKNATTIVILDADNFGLAQLHQLRGRVGRDGSEGLCLAVSSAAPDSIGAQRLEAFCRFRDGFELAKADLALRQSGNLLGADQSGRRSGFKILNLARDEQLIDNSRTDADQLVRTDPTLASHPALAWALNYRLTDEEIDFLNRS